MPQGDKSSYTDKQKRQAEHIEDSYKEKGVSQDEAEERAWRVGSSRVDLQACKLEYSIVSPK